MKQCYIPKSFRPDTLNFIEVLGAIIEEYQAAGFVLTVRQLYYQCVARGIIPNTLQDYKRMASITNDAKMAGLLDWEAIEDRTRAFIKQTRWQSGSQIIEAVERSYHQDMWRNQENRVFVIVEKEALVGVLERVCANFDVPLLAARGYPSGSVLREFSKDDLLGAVNEGQRPVILHLGDHDPSGIDMSRDLSERLSLFTGREVELYRLALNRSQIEELRPPENPAKTTDSRYEQYRAVHGDKSWELDALTPTFLAELVTSNVRKYIDRAAWADTEQEISDVKERLHEFAANW